MLRLEKMLKAHPKPGRVDSARLADCINTCTECGQICTSCADACLAEEKLQMLTRCIRLDLDCADLCVATVRVMLRQTETEPFIVKAQLQALIASARACGQECEKHAERHEHCRICMESCRECVESCERMLQTLG